MTKDSLTTGDTHLWTFGGSAAVYKSPYNYFEDSQGLHIGVQSNVGGQWSGYYAARGENAQLFHAVLSLPSAAIPTNSFNTGLYVQTGGTNVDYVTCAGGVDSGGYYWTVVQATGNAFGATQSNTLWFQWMNNQPLTRDCTIVTNGGNLLDVYLDGTLVYASNSMNLGYQYPLTTFLEVQTTDNTTMHFSVYDDYYATTSDTVTVNGAPPGSTVEIVSTSGTILAQAQANGTGPTMMNIASYHMPLNANVEVVALGSVIASTPAPSLVYGGDVYTVGTSVATGGQTSLGPVYTSSPWTSTVINSNVGQGIRLHVCLLGLCL